MNSSERKKDGSSLPASAVVADAGDSYRGSKGSALDVSKIEISEVISNWSDNPHQVPIGGWANAEPHPEDDRRYRDLRLDIEELKLLMLLVDNDDDWRLSERHRLGRVVLRLNREALLRKLAFAMAYRPKRKAKTESDEFLDRNERPYKLSANRAKPSFRLEKAPEFWSKTNDQPSGRLHGETAIAFLKRVYKPYEGSITRADIRRLDRPLYDAISRHISRHGDNLPFDLPSRDETTEKAVASHRDEDSYEQVKELERQAAAMRRRLVKATARNT